MLDKEYTNLLTSEQPTDLEIQKTVLYASVATLLDQVAKERVMDFVSVFTHEFQTEDKEEYSPERIAAYTKAVCQNLGYDDQKLTDEDHEELSSRLNMDLYTLRRYLLKDKIPVDGNTISMVNGNFQDIIAQLENNLEPPHSDSVVIRMNYIPTEPAAEDESSQVPEKVFVEMRTASHYYRGSSVSDLWGPMYGMRFLVGEKGGISLKMIYASKRVEEAILEGDESLERDVLALFATYLVSLTHALPRVNYWSNNGDGRTRAEEIYDQALQARNKILMPLYE